MPPVGLAVVDVGEDGDAGLDGVVGADDEGDVADEDGGADVAALLLGELGGAEDEAADEDALPTVMEMSSTSKVAPRGTCRPTTLRSARAPDTEEV